MYCHLLYVNKQFVINDKLLLEKSNQESVPFLIALDATSNCCLSAKISSSTSGSSNWK